MGNKDGIMENILSRDETNLFFVLKHFRFLRDYGFKRFYINCFGSEVILELSSIKKDIKIRFLWAGNSNLQIHIIRPFFLNDKQINILNLVKNDNEKKELLKLDNCEGIEFVLKKYSSFFEFYVLPFLIKSKWL